MLRGACCVCLGVVWRACVLCGVVCCNVIPCVGSMCDMEVTQQGLCQLLFRGC